MPDALKKHILKFASLDDEEFERIADYFDIIEVKKKHILHQAPGICRYHYFIVEGCLRMYFINDKGMERTTEFAIENWWLTDHHSYNQQCASEFCIQAVENARIMRITKAKEEALLHTFPALEKYFRNIYQRAFAAGQMRKKFLDQFTREELYHHFSSHFPEFIQRVPQYLIASFLGFTPEYLSEIRRKELS